MSSGKPLMFSTEYKSSNIMDFFTHMVKYILYGHFIPYGHFPLWTLFHMDILPYGQFADSPFQVICQKMAMFEQLNDQLLVNSK